MGWRRLSLLLFLPLFIHACSTSHVDDSIRMGLASSPMNLDPRYATDATSERINRLLYQRLVAFDEQSMPVPDIADWRRLSPRHYRFRLNPEAGRFSHQRKLDADDVIATYRYVLDAKNASPKRSGLVLIESLTKVDELTIDFKLSRADPLFPAYLTLDILPADLIADDHDFAHQPVGSGPFSFHSWPVSGKLLLVRRSDKRLFEFVEVKNPTVRVLKLLRGEIDMLQNDISPELIGYLESQSAIEIAQRHGSNFTYIGFNLRDPHTGDPRVRLAIAHALDRQAIIEHVMHGAARQAEALLPPEHWAGAPSLMVYEYDPEKAARLLNDAGYTTADPLRLVYKTSSDPYRIRLATVIQSQLKAVGIEVELRSYDWGTFFGDIKGGNFQLYSLSWVGIRTPDIFRYVFGSDSLPPTGANRGRYVSHAVDRLLRQVESADTLERQADLYHRIQKQLHQDLPYLPLWYEAQVSASNPRVSGYRLMTDGNYDGLEQVRLRQPEETSDAQIAVAH
ncbi:MAG: ABC transporter substrate-binding protein [Candidatus Thiodiazotropha endolucinida]